MQVADSVAAVSLADAVSASVSYDQLRVSDDTLYWLETRPDAGGVTTLTRWRSGESTRDASPAGFNVTNSVHAYGGGSFAVGEGSLWCVGEGGLYEGRHGGELELVSRSSLGDLTLGDGELLAVRETDRGDELIAIPLTGTRQRRTLIRAVQCSPAARITPACAGSRLLELRRYRSTSRFSFTRFRKVVPLGLVL